MEAGDLSSRDILGFYCVMRHEMRGLVGGYLLLNAAGRPLEFHCTSPVQPTRVQQILFGPTLDSYLYGEHIGQTLLGKSELEPLAIFTDSPRGLALRDFTQQCVALVHGDDGAAALPATPSGWRVEGGHASVDGASVFELGRNRVSVRADRSTDRQFMADRLGTLEQFDLGEPFARIREAIEEADKAGRG